MKTKKWAPKKIIILVALMGLVAGCGAGRRAIRQISEENKQNFALADEMTIDLHIIWPQIAGAFNAGKELLPPPITNRVKRINRIMLNKEVKDISKQDRSEAGMLFLFLLGDSAQLAYRAYAPDIMNLLKIMGLL